MLSASLAELTDKKVPTFGEFAREWGAEQEASTSLRESTKKAKIYQLRRYLIPAFDKIRLDEFSNKHWNAFVADTRADYPTWRITRYFNSRKTVNEILNAAVTRGIIERKPKLDNPDAPKKVGRVLTDKETWWILRSTTYRIFRVFFYVLYKQGFRPREVLKWEKSMIKFDDGGRMWVDVPARITKTARSRMVPINQTAAKHICRLMKENPDSRFVFQNRIHPDQPQLSYHGAFKTACSKVRRDHPDFKPCVPYDWRRSKITREMIAGKQPVYLGMLLDTSVGQIQGTYTKADAKTLMALVE